MHCSGTIRLLVILNLEGPGGIEGPRKGSLVYKYISSAIRVSAFQTQDPLHLPYSLSAVVWMVDFHDPVVVDGDSRAYRFGAFSGSEEHIDWIFFCKLHARSFGTLWLASFCESTWR